jgi:uncharacterized tellurite resistance protein B-like protein
VFLIAGTKGETSTVGRGEFYCPQCETYTRYLHQQVHQKATVFFVPVANLKLLGEYVECQSCDGTFKMEILNYDPQEEQLEIEALYHIGIKKVMTMMMLADGKIEDREIVMMKDIYRKVSEDELLDSEIEKEIDSCQRHPTDMEEFLKDIFPVLNEHGREMIFKMSYYIAIADGKYRSEEEKLLKKIGKILQLSPAHIKGIISEIHE